MTDANVLGAFISMVTPGNANAAAIFLANGTSVSPFLMFTIERR